MRRALSLALALCACGGEEQQHCLSADATTCVEVSGLARLLVLGAAGSAAFHASCEAGGGEPEGGPCNANGRVSGCATVDETVDMITWTYIGELGDVACASNELKLRGDGTPCSAAGGAQVELQVTNAGGVTSTLYWSDTTCDETAIVALEPGASSPLTAYVGHALRLRAGSDDPYGLVLWDGVVADATALSIP